MGEKERDREKDRGRDKDKRDDRDRIVKDRDKDRRDRSREPRRDDRDWGKGKGKCKKGDDYDSRPPRPVWDPRNARNLDLENERSGRSGLPRYSDHDDRSAAPADFEPAAKRMRGGGSPTRWAHDLFETVSKDP